MIQIYLVKMECLCCHDALLNTIVVLPGTLRQHQTWISDSASHGSEDNSGRKLGGNLRWGAIWNIGGSCQENLNNHHFNQNNVLMIIIMIQMYIVLSTLNRDFKSPLFVKIEKNKQI